MRAGSHSKFEIENFKIAPQPLRFPPFSILRNIKQVTLRDDP
jgi:hypothetical protein